jgi:TetR/AcrR family transcriptional regulator, mexJK operon transcriptional repressor
MSGNPAKRQAIIDAAHRGFIANGFTNTSVDAIAAEADVSKQTIYNNFGDKERLFGAVIEHAQSDADSVFEGMFGGALEDSDRRETGFRELGRRLTRAALKDDVAALRRLIITEWSRHPQLLRDWARKRPQLDKGLRALIDAQVKQGALDVPDVARAAEEFMLVTTVNALSRSLYGQRKLSGAEINRIVDDGVELWLRAYRAR